MSGIVNEAAEINAPLSGEVIRLDVSTTGTLYVIPTRLKGQYCRFTLFSDDLTTAVAADIVFGGSSISVTYDTDSAAPGGVIATSTSTGARVSNVGGPVTWIIPDSSDVTHFYVDASGNGHLEILKE